MLDKRVVEDVLQAALSTGADFAEVFAENKYVTSLTLIGGKVEQANAGHDYGVGIRIFKGTNSIYAYTNNSARENLIRVAGDAAISIQGIPTNMNVRLVKADIPQVHTIRKYPADISKPDKVALLKTGYEAAKSCDESISQVTGYYLDEDQEILVANSEGTWAEDRRVRTRTGFSAVSSLNGEMQTGQANIGEHRGFELYDTINIADYGKEAARVAVTMAKADLCPSGKMPVIIDNGFGGVIFHEACGHGLEATSVAKGTSVYTDKLGQQIASELVTAIDDGTIAHAWGSNHVDDEGVPTRRNVLIENGVLKSYLVDRMGGKRMNMEPTGCGRRQSYKYEPTSRMSNTFIAPGKSTTAEIIGATDMGLYAKRMGGGSVNPATGEFNFSVQEGYLIRNGKIAEPVRGATLIGTGLDVLKKIDMVGDNLAHGQGMCGSLSGSIPTNVGQPMLRVSELTVGGRKGAE